MLSTLSLVRREFSAYFISPIAYVVLTVFLAATGYLFFRTLAELTAEGPYGVEFPMQMMLGLGDLQSLKGVLAFQAFWVVFLIIPPLLTMRLFAEERQSGTLEMLLTAPLRDWQIVLSKFLAAYGLYVVLWLPTLIYLPALLDMQVTVPEPSWNPWNITLLSGVGALALAAVGVFLPGEFLPRLLVVAFVALAIAGVAAVTADDLVPPAVVQLVGNAALAKWAIAGAAALLVLLIVLVFPRDGLSRWLVVLLAFAGVAAIGVGTWGQWHFDAAPLLWVETGIDPNPALTTYAGLALVGAMFLALGMFVSSLVRNPVVAALISLALNMAFVVAGFWLIDMDPGSFLYQVLAYFTVPLHFERNFTRGLIDTRQLVLYGSVALFFLFLTVRSLEVRR